MKATKRFSLIFLVILIVSCFGVAQPTSAVPVPECVKLTYQPNSICQMGNYSVGSAQVFLSGYKLPQDSSLDGKYYRLSGQLIDYGYCMILVVRQMKSCEAPTISGVTK
jgi:hypothetical protein